MENNVNFVPTGLAGSPQSNALSLDELQFRNLQNQQRPMQRNQYGFIPPDLPYVDPNLPVMGTPEMMQGIQPNPTNVGANGLANDEKYRFLHSKEGVNNTYTTKNQAGSSAYGRYQIMPSTGKEMAGKLGLKGSWDLPENQDKVMDGLDKQYASVLTRLKQPVTQKTKYAVHQLGRARAARYFNGNLTDRDVSVMNDNLPEKLKSNDKNTVLANWDRTYQ